MRYVWGLPNAIEALSTARKGLPKPVPSAGALPVYPYEINVASFTLYQAEGRVLLRWEASKQNPSAASAILRLASLVQRVLALRLIRRAPLAIGGQS